MCFEEVQAVNKTDYKDMWVFIERDGDSVLPGRGKGSYPKGKETCKNKDF